MLQTVPYKRKDRFFITLSKSLQHRSRREQSGSAPTSLTSYLNRVGLSSHCSAAWLSSSQAMNSLCGRHLWCRPFTSSPNGIFLKHKAAIPRRIHCLVLTPAITKLSLKLQLRAKKNSRQTIALTWCNTFCAPSAAVWNGAVAEVISVIGA